MMINIKTKALYINIVMLSVIYLAELVYILYLNSGVFSYTLDDPYIHMALAKNIAAGHYGINLTEYSAPSSSIIWPFILAVFSGAGWFDYVPLIINFICSLGTVYLYTQLFSMLFTAANAQRQTLLTIIATMAIVFITNIIGLAFTGMEHSLQVYISLLAVYGVIISLREQRVPWWLVLAVIAGPLVRYENLALSLPAIVYLVAQRYWLAAVSSGLLLVASVSGFSAYLHTLGLGYWPSSIIAKSALLEKGHLAAVIDTMLSHLAFVPVSIFLISVLMLALYNCFNTKAADKYLALIIGTAIIAHMLFGYSGWYYRYDMYIVSAATMGIIYSFRGALSKIYNALYKELDESSPVTYTLVLLIICCGVGFNSWKTTATTAIAANNIFEQQYQMHRFVNDYYKAPVAINDLGWVAYENPNYVLDLWGLASLEALKSRQTATDSAWMDKLASKHNVKLAIIYDSWFRNKPFTWRPVAVMELGKERITPASNYVTFYALDSNSYEKVKPMLLQFKDSLPNGVKLTVY
ncbi:hypothetical protein [Sporomusa sp. KB1]|jgi:hypothetical protein|uniref:hypothetical protein n=1 Tax=Sporomusa sp. KB1 TaxID=943346 RepID=UPI0011AAD12D|nr:hypothetical protein [Sporomusa sp. KB1]TWH51628.1 hypothetical protein Salpa_0070 [Sporomusa sp. KB1]TWH52207.1 hypothetical protein Salpa_0729 [Sporomusa sp. KB1]